MTNLSVNVNKIALLRNARGGNNPNLIAMVRRAIDAGVHGITVHPRPDQRHIRNSDVFEIAEFLTGYPSVEFNIEGNPADEFMKMVCRVEPAQCTLVPDAVDQITSDHGWDPGNDMEILQPVIGRLQDHGIRVSIFMDAREQLMAPAAQTGCDRVELYTGPYADMFGTMDHDKSFQQYRIAAAAAIQNGMGVNAGHDLNLKNLPAFLKIEGILEVSIGHAIMVESFDYGFEETISRYLDIVSARIH